MESPNLSALAAALKLSPSTVSRVLSGQAERFRISPATRERVLAAAAKSGLVVDAVARGLRLRTTHTLGLVIPDISNPFFAALARQIEHQARAHGYSVLLADSQESVEVEAEAVRLMRGRRVDGLVIAPVGTASRVALAPLAGRLPLVLIDRILPDFAGPSVTADNFAGARDATRLLIARGHRRIGCLQGRPDSSVQEERLRGHQAALAEAGIAMDPALLCGGVHAPDAGRLGMETWFGPSGAAPTAVLAFGNLLALGALQALRRLGLGVPEDVSLIAFDDQPWTELIAPPLTTVAQPVEALAEAAMRRLFERLRATASASPAASAEVLSVRLIERDSVAAPAALPKTCLTSLSS
jgi:LacI family transcriptional regulator